MRRRPLRCTVFVAVTAMTTAMLSAPAVQAAPEPATTHDKRAPEVRSRSDGALAKLHPRLRERVEKGETKVAKVFATVVGDGAATRKLLGSDHLAKAGSGGIVTGSIPTQALPKLAGTQGVVSVQPLDRGRTGSPLGDPDPRMHSSEAKRKASLEALSEDEVPYPQAPPPKGSNFEAMKDLDVLDARTHHFTEAWKDGFTGSGVTVGVLDGGTDFGHPDLLNTWQTWSGQTGKRAGWNGWPKAFDPYGTMLWLSYPTDIDDGLSWYTKTTSATCTQAPTCAIRFAVKTGPSRNDYSIPAGTKKHTYEFPAAWTKSGTVKLTSHPDDYLLEVREERPGVLVTDPKKAGSYDTVYVDLDGDYDFGDEKPVTKSSPASYRDMNGDGYTDLSGGLLYYISDGHTAVPGGLDAFGVLDTSYGPGDLLAWTGDFDPGIGGHGTLTASNVVGQGVTNAKLPTFDDLPGDGKYPGAVLGGAPNAKLTPFGDVYFGMPFANEFGYLLSTRSGVDVTSNSYGYSSSDNDGWDSASQEADVILDGSATTSLFSTGNGAPGFGTVAPPKPSAGIAVGASTQNGGTGADSLVKTTQIRDNDVVVWSDRGFGANGRNGVDLVADGSSSAGSTTLNWGTLNVGLGGRGAWGAWGGTSRSCPVAAGAAALVYEAYKRAHGGKVPGGFHATAKQILQSSAMDLGYDAITQGSGSVDAGKAVRTALGERASVSPSEWRVGDYRGKEYPVFTHVVAPGGSDEQRFDFAGAGTWKVQSRQLLRTDTETFKVSTSDVSKESTYNTEAPDYLVDLTKKVEAHKDADLMVVRAKFPYAQFDGNDDYKADQTWRLLTYDWTDVDKDGRLWTDKDGDSAVDHTNLDSYDIDGAPDIDYANSEIDGGEYVRYMVNRAYGTSLMSFVRDPHERMTDGMFLGLQHPLPNKNIPVTDFDIEIDWYENSDWNWVSTPSHARDSFTASVKVPKGTPYGMYTGAVVLSLKGDSIVVPVSVAVAATMRQDENGAPQGAIDFGGEAVASAQRNSMYNNGSVFGASDWLWRPESGDWRFYFLDVPRKVPAGTKFLANTSWQGTAPHTDVDTLIMGRAENTFQVLPSTVFGGPYKLATVGKSPNTNIGAGVWRFDTSSGGAADLVTAPMQEGLQTVALHQVGWQGDAFDTPVGTQLGSATVTPSAADVDTDSDTGGFDVTFESTVPLDSLSGEAFGLSQPTTTTETAHQDDPDDPASASVKKDLKIDHAARLTVSTRLADNDIDLWVVRDADGDGSFTTDEIVGSSASVTGDEVVDIANPEDGDYQIWVQGYTVSGTPEFPLVVDALQGDDLTVTGLPKGSLPADTPVTLHVAYDKEMTTNEDYFGELQLGPRSAPGAVTVPIRVSRTD